MAKQKGVAAPQYTDEQKVEKSALVCDLYQTQQSTLESCCKTAGISTRSFHLWRVQIAEIAERYKKAKVGKDDFYFEEVIKPLAETALQRLLKGEQKTEIREEGETVNETFVVKKRTTTKSEILPNPTLTIFAMKGIHPERFRERVDHGGNLNLNVSGAEALTPAEESALKAIALANK